MQPENTAFIEFRDVWLAYSDALRAQNQFAVEAIDLQVPRGAFIAIVGSSGCGKSTFMKLTTGLRQPSMGKIRVAGQPVTGPLKISGMAFQAPSLLPWRSTLDNVLLPLEIVATGLATLEPELEDVLRVLGARRWDVLVKVGLPRSLPYFYASLKVAITLAFVGTTVSEMTAANEGIGYLLVSAGSSMQMGLAFAGLIVVGAMAMVMYELFSLVEKHTTAWAHRGTQGG